MKKDAADAAEKAATLPVHAILESVSGTALADHLKGERSDDEAVSDGSDGENDAALVASTVWDPLCGLKSGYGRRCRRNNPKMDRAVKHQLMAMFSQGDITGSRMTPEGAFEELCKIGVVTNNWSARLVVTPDKIKAFFSAMAQKEKAAKKRNEQNVDAKRKCKIPWTLLLCRHFVTDKRHALSSNLYMKTNNRKTGLATYTHNQHTHTHKLRQ